MNGSQIFRKYLLLALPLAVVLSGCGPMGSLIKPPRSEVENTFTPQTVVVQRPPVVESAQDYAYQFAPMALFAQTSYRKDITKNKDREGHGCDYLKKEEGYEVVVRLHMPASANGHWERWLEPGSCVEEGGMFFETYVHKNKSEVIDLAVIAFRGTEYTSIYEIRHDWGANFSGVVPFLGREYERARDHAIPLITKLHQLRGSDNKPIPIYLTGHSLGGGLAQHVAYVADKMVTATYAFDNSPTTNWAQLRDYEQVRDPVIHRVYQERESLESLRNIASRANITRYHRTDYAFDLVKTKGIEAHSISNLTCGFAQMVANQKDEPEYGDKNPFDYSKASAKATVDDMCRCP